LAGGEVDIFVLVEVLTEALGRDVIMPGRSIVMAGAAVRDSPKRLPFTLIFARLRLSEGL
jgi:hypothetical protein